MNASKRFFFAVLLVFLPGACVFLPEKENNTPTKKDEEEENTSELVADSVSIWLKIRPLCPFEYKIGRVDYFIYEDSLIGHYISTEEYPLEIKVDKGVDLKKIYALANGFGEYNEMALWHHDNFKELVMDIRDERPGYPFMSGVLDIPKEYGDTLEVGLKALSSEIRIRSVSNLAQDYSLLEAPRIYIRNSYCRARPYSDYNASSGEYIEGERVFLSQDIGIYSLYPDIRLYTYPDDIPVSELCPASELVIEYEKEGRIYERSWSLYPLERNSLVILDLDII